MQFNVKQFLDDINADYTLKESSYEGKPCKCYALEKCFFDESHTKNDACLFQYEGGAIAYKCQHDSCSQHDWNAVKSHYKSLDFKVYWSQSSEAAKKDTGETDSSLELISGYEICKKPVEQKPIITGFLNEKEPAIISGSGGIGKSMLIFYLAYYLARDKESKSMLWDKFSVPPITRSSLFIQSENTIGQVGLRLSRMAGSDPENQEALKRILSPQINGDILTTGKNLSDPKFQQWVIDSIHMSEDLYGFKIDLLFIDPLISFVSGDENDSVKMRSDLDGITRIAFAAGVTPIVVHHNKKNGQGYRGSSAILDWARNMVSLSPEKSYNDGACIKVQHEKCNNFQMFDDFRVKITPDNKFECLDSMQSYGDTERYGQIMEVLSENGDEVETQTKLVQLLAAKSDSSRTTCQRRIKDAVNQGWIIEAQEGSKLIYSLGKPNA